MGVFLAEPLLGIAGPSHPGLRRGRDIRFRVQPRIRVLQNRHELIAGLVRGHAAPRKGVQRLTCGRFNLTAEIRPERPAGLPHRLKIGFVINPVLVQPVPLDDFAMFIGLERLSHLVQALLQVEPAGLLQLVHRTVRQPAKQFLILPGQGIQDPVHAFMDQGRLVQFHLIGGELPDFTGKGFQRLLEKLVDRTDGEGPVIVEHVHQQARRPLADLLHRREFRQEFLDIGRLRGLMREDIQFLEDTAFHLVRRLVGKGDRQDVPVGITFLAAQQQLNIGLGQVVRLA